MFSCIEAPDVAGLGAEDPGLLGLVHKVGVINEGQGIKVCKIIWIFVYTLTKFVIMK